MRRKDVDSLDPGRDYWVLAVVAPERDWPAAPGCRRGARFLVDSGTLAPTRDDFDPFDSRLSCLTFLMDHRGALNAALPGAPVKCVKLERWLLGME